ncbi:hypothetical protein Tco_1341003 [Tanacetum coccineum]
MANIPYTAEYNVFAVETQHTEQPENMNDKSLMEKVDSNTTPDSSDMCNNEFHVDHNTDDNEDEHLQSRLEHQLDKPITHETIVLVKDLLMPLADKTRYVQYLEKEVDALQSDKNDFSNEYDLLLQECLSKDIMCSILHSLADIDEQTKMQCLYLEKIKESECLKIKLSKQTKNEQLKNDKVWKQKESSSFRDQNEQYFAIQDLKAQLQDKNITISELKKLIENMKDKGVDTNFEKPSILGKPPLQPLRNQPVVRQPTAFKSERSSLSKHRFASQVIVKNDFTKPVTPHSWTQARQYVFIKSHHVNAPSPSKNSTKRVSFQSPQESVGSNDMVHNYYLEEAKKMHNFRKKKSLNSKPSVITPTRLPNTASGSKLKSSNSNQQPRNWPPSMSSRISNRAINIVEPPRNSNPFLKSKDLACPTCKKVHLH